MQWGVGWTFDGEQKFEGAGFTVGDEQIFGKWQEFVYPFLRIIPERWGPVKVTHYPSTFGDNKHCGTELKKFVSLTVVTI